MKYTRRTRTPAKNMDLAEKSLRKSIAYLAYAVDEDVPDMNSDVLMLIEALAKSGKRIQDLALLLANKPERCKANNI